MQTPQILGWKLNSAWWLLFPREGWTWLFIFQRILWIKSFPIWVLVWWLVFFQPCLTSSTFLGALDKLAALWYSYLYSFSSGPRGPSRTFHASLLYSCSYSCTVGLTFLKSSSLRMVNFIRILIVRNFGVHVPGLGPYQDSGCAL